MTRLLSVIIVLMLACYHGNAKENFEISTPVGLPEEGINKVLCMKSGATLLFHLEISKPISVQVFDADHKRIATSHLSPKVLDVSTLSTAVFKGLYEVNNEAVLFLEQQKIGRHSLIRLRIDPVKGKLIDETTVAKWKSVSRPAHFLVMKHKKETGYALLFAQDAPQFRESDVYVAYYNARHEVIRKVPLVFDRSKYDFISVMGAESLPEGVCVSLRLSNMVVNGTGTSTESAARYNHFLEVFVIPRDSVSPMSRLYDLSTDVQPHYVTASHNSFAGNYNLLLLNFREAFIRYGIEMRPTALQSDLFFSLSDNDLSGKYRWITHNLANSLLREKADTNKYFSGLPVRMFTNENGLTTIISESYERYISADGYSRYQAFSPYLNGFRTTQLDDPTNPLWQTPNTSTQYNKFIAADNYNRTQSFETFLGNLCITQVDDEGNEIWGTVLPKSQYYRSFKHYYRPSDLARRWQEQAMFNDIPPQITERQFMSANVYSANGNLYIIYNDCGKNINNSIADPGDTVYSSSLANACYYKVDKKHGITKDYLLGEPLIKEYKSIFVEGADFDEERATYASLIRYKRGEYVSLRMAWVKLD